MRINKIFIAITFLIIFVLTCVIILLLINNKEETKVEENPLEYFKEVEKENNLEKGFNDINDFIFNGKKINGVTFNELKDEIKLEIMKIALSINKKINEEIPKYREKIKDIKSKIVDLYIDTTNDICNKNEELCLNVKKDFQSLKENFGITFDYIKEYSKKGFEKVKDWYEEVIK
jgi:hypothetical protein